MPHQTSPQRNWPTLGCGLGLRREHYDFITKNWPRVDWFEAISENYMNTGGRPLHILEEVRKRYPVGLHGVALSLGSCDSLNLNYLQSLKRLADRIEPAIISDHLCWSGVDGEVLHDLLPLPFTEEALSHVVSRIGQVQDYLGREILIENVSTYVTYKHSVMPEWEFIREIAGKSGCGILLDINNIYVNAVNHGFDPKEYLRNIPGELVGQFHLAGHTNMGKFLFDTHSAEVLERVWELYEEALKLYGPVSTLIERDENIPAFEEMMKEVEKAKQMALQSGNARECLTDPAYVIASPPKADEAISKFGAGVIFDTQIASAAAPPRNDNSRGAIALLDLQHWMKAKIHHCSNSASLDDVGAIRELPLLNSQGGDPGIERMSVYANGYIARTRDGLKDVYEAVHHLVGAEAFVEMAEAYAAVHPSRDYNLSHIGGEFPEFLKSYALTREFPFLPDLARMEYWIAQTFHTFDEPPMDAGKLAEISLEDWDTAHFYFQPSVHIDASDWPVLDLWNARKTPVSEINVALVNRPQKVLICRQGIQMRVGMLNEMQFSILAGLLSGKSLGEVCEDLAQANEEEPVPIASWFSEWAGLGLITRFEIGIRPPGHGRIG